MQLILSMQNDRGETPNVSYVLDDPTPPLVKDFPPAEKYERFKYLHDMLPLIDDEVYEAFHTMLTDPQNVGGITLDRTGIEQNVKFTAAMVQHITDLGEVRLWDGAPPHCYWIFREVVANLLDVV